MGTNFYARIIPSEKEKQELIEAIQNNQYNIIVNMARTLYGDRSKYSGMGNKIHLGKRSEGWKFLWNPNVIKVFDADALEIKWRYVYPLTKEGIISFLMRPDVEIVDEYGGYLDVNDFLEMVVDWHPDGLDNKEYYTNPKYEAGYFYKDTSEIEKWRSLGYEPEYGEFYSDGLRFSTSIDFC